MQKTGEKKRPRPRARGKRTLVELPDGAKKLATINRWELWRIPPDPESGWVNYWLRHEGRWRPGSRIFRLGCNGERMARSSDQARMHMDLRRLAYRFEELCEADAAMVLKESSDALRSA